tara:strand:- start:164 stop:457 length:294 start_codon:yes stop_codon:yes gene_type:complete
VVVEVQGIVFQSVYLEVQVVEQGMVEVLVVLLEEVVIHLLQTRLKVMMEVQNLAIQILEAAVEMVVEVLEVLEVQVFRQLLQVIHVLEVQQVQVYQI